MEPSNPLDSQWISIHIRDHLEGRDINIRDSLITPGDFHSPDDPSVTLTESAIDKMVIPSDGLGEVCATGRRGSEGWLDLFDGDKKICELHWDNRSGSYVNDFEVLEGDERYKVECSGWSSAKGPLGHVFIDVSDADNIGKGNGQRKLGALGALEEEKVGEAVIAGKSSV
ncbi:Aegerolysin-domain-containing protein [Aspergillus granulosus]|uniref:Aegerolysin-domain-containing protein n=1 Tax=Aspergillus granulosus TaxID=176169 RepID=A0ABR4HTT4_9EURO